MCVTALGITGLLGAHLVEGADAQGDCRQVELAVCLLRQLACPRVPGFGRVEMVKVLLGAPEHGADSDLALDVTGFLEEGKGLRAELDGSPAVVHLDLHYRLIPEIRPQQPEVSDRPRGVQSFRKASVSLGKALLVF